MKTLKMPAQVKQQLSWVDELEIKQQRKQSRSLRELRQGKKSFWMPNE